MRGYLTSAVAEVWLVCGELVIGVASQLGSEVSMLQGYHATSGHAMSKNRCFHFLVFPERGCVVKIKNSLQ